jgi:hypothetical protein
MKCKFSSAVAWFTAIWAIVLSGCAAPKSTLTSNGESLAEAWHIVSNKTFVDLTHAFSPTTLVWSGFGPVTFAPEADPATGRPYTIEHDGWRALQ